MLHTKFRGNRTAGSGEDICRCFTIILNRPGGHFGHVTSITSTNYNFHVPKSLQTIFD